MNRKSLDMVGCILAMQFINIEEMVINNNFLVVTYWDKLGMQNVVEHKIPEGDTAEVAKIFCKTFIKTLLKDSHPKARVIQ